MHRPNAGVALAALHSDWESVMDHVDPKCQRRSRQRGEQNKLIFPRMASDSFGLAI